MNADPKPTNTAPDSEPTATLTTLPIWLVVVMLLLLCWAAIAFDRHGGWFEAQVYEPYASIADLERYQPRAGGGPNLSRGKAVFEQTCALCHNPDGAGKPNQAPPLAGSDWVNATGPNRIIHIVLLGMNGPITVSGKQYDFSSGMTPFGSLPDEDLAAALSYIRQAWGNKAPPVTAENIQSVRAKLGNRTQSLTPDEAMGLPLEIK